MDSIIKTTWKTTFMLFLFFMTSSMAIGQVDIKLNNEIDVLDLFTLEINEVNQLLKRPSKITREPVTQRFCGITRGRYEKLFYKKQRLSIETWKRIGYVRRGYLNKWNKDKYYENCHVRSLTVHSNTDITVNGVLLATINKANIDIKLQGFLKKNGDYEYIVANKQGDQFILSFSLENDRISEIYLKKYYPV